jgi:hypothetical protein
VEPEEEEVELEESLLRPFQDSLEVFQTESFEELTNGIISVASQISSVPALIGHFPVSADPLRSLAAVLGVPGDPAQASLFIIHELAVHLRRTGRSEELVHFVSESVAIDSALLALLSQPILARDAISAITVLSNITSCTAKWILLRIVRTGVLTCILDLLSFFNPQQARGREKDPLSEIPYLQDGIDADYSAFHVPLVRFARFFLRHSGVNFYLGTSELISHVMGLCTAFGTASFDSPEDMRLVRVACKALVNAAGTAPSELLQCFLDLQFQTTLFRIISGSDSLRGLGLAIIEKLVFHIDRPRQLQRLTGAGLNQIVMDMLLSDESEIRGIAYNCLLNIAANQGKFSEAWIAQEGLLEHLEAKMKDESFKERIEILRIFGNLLTKENITPELLDRINVVEMLLPVMQTGALDVIDIAIDIFEQVLAALEDIDPEKRGQFVRQLREEGAPELLDNIADDESLSLYTKALHFSKELTAED